MPNAAIKGSVSGGKFLPVNAELFKKSIEKFEGKTCEVVVRAISKGRSNQQNKYMWKVVYGILADWSGDDPQSIHMQMTAMFAIPRVIENKLQKNVVVQGSTSRMSTVEIEEY